MAHGNAWAAKMLGDNVHLIRWVNAYFFSHMSTAVFTRLCLLKVQEVLDLNTTVGTD